MSCGRLSSLALLGCLLLASSCGRGRKDPSLSGLGPFVSTTSSRGLPGWLRKQSVLQWAWLQARFASGLLPSRLNMVNWNPGKPALQ
ncbi:hypothetical protein E2320_007183 [Naja naja]|nr:hypothetical protein E2320_007183 [Naja naja]